MKKILPLVLCVTVLPTLLLAGTAAYIGSQFNARKTNDDLEEKNAKEEWTVIFDGKSLKGWEGNLKYFRVEDNAIVAGNLKEKIPNNEFLCTEKKYKDFELVLKAKLIGKGKNAGIQFRSKRKKDHHEVIGYQCDMGQMKGHSIWGYLYDESRRRKFLVEADPKKTDEATNVGEWNEFRIRCQGNRIQIWVNDFRTVNYAEADESIDRSGIIGLQIHSGPPAEAWYKDIKIKELK